MTRCLSCNRELPPQVGPGRPRRFCDDRCRVRYARASAAPDWTQGAEPVRLERINIPAASLPDLEAMTVAQQRGIFATARQELARRTPDGRAWRWRTWAEHEAAFDELFGEVG